MANIYLSKLDDFAENLKKSFNKGKSKENLEYQRAASKLYYIRRKNRANWENWNEQQRKEALRLQKDAINYMHSLPSKRANNVLMGTSDSRLSFLSSPLALEKEKGTRFSEFLKTSAFFGFSLYY